VTGLSLTNRHGIGTRASHTRAPLAPSILSEGGGFNPTLDLGGGAGARGNREAGRGWRL
jgi:hypothetical protein